MEQHEFYMAKALKLARSALDENEFPVGCVIVYQNEIISSGGRKHTRAETENEIDHAEIRALIGLPKVSAKLIQTQMTIYTTLEPCLMCYAAILLSGIRKIVYAYEDVMGGGVNCDLKRLRPLYQEMDIHIVPGILRADSLSLFQAFFKRSENTYLKGTLLEKITLNQ